MCGSQAFGSTSHFLVKQLHAALRYSPFAFADPRLESAFQKELPERVRNNLTTWLCLGYGFAVGIMHRMYRHLDLPLYRLPIQFWIPLVSALVNTGVLFVALKTSAAYSKHWVSWSVLVRAHVAGAALLTWYLTEPEPLRGPVTILGGAFTLIVVTPTPNLR